MRSLGQREPVHVILRRVDDTYCDPLELNPESQLGVTGLVQATRAGTVSVVNALGSGVLENPALAAFEEAVARHLLGRPLRLPAVPSWWCGDPVARAYVLEAGWLDVDPTNDQLVNGRYVVAAFGRDYRDVPPISGVIYAEGSSSTLTVKVDVTVV
jgi:uncharacterized circularly permuted ATP-grasp superfamily protein